MHERLQYLIKDSGLSSSRFAELVGIQPSAVSHLISGRNKPGFDILAKILNKFPDLNPRWLILGEEPVYLKSDSKTSGKRLPGVTSYEQAEDETKYGEFPEKQTILPGSDKIPKEPSANSTPPLITPSDLFTGNPVNKTSTDNQKDDERSEIDKIVIFYNDGTFVSFKGR